MSDCMRKVRQAQNRWCLKSRRGKNDRAGRAGAPCV